MAADVVDSSSLKILSLNISGLRKKTNNVSILIIKYKPDFIFLQETNINSIFLERQVIESLKLEPNSCFFNYNINKSNGTCILQTSDKWQITFVKFFQEGRTILMKIRNGNKLKTLINIYAPANPAQRIAFYDELFKILSKNKSDDCFLAGDFNITLQDKDILGLRGKQRQGRYELSQIIQLLQLKDSFRALYPEKKETTYENNSVIRASRIDHAYVNINCNVLLFKHLTETLLFTDHKGVLIESGSFMQRKTSSHWIFNNTLLQNKDFVKSIENVIDENKRLKDEVFFEKFEQMKSVFKTIAIRYGSKSNKERSKREFILEKTIIAFEKKKNYSEEYEKLKLELDEIRNYKYKGAFIRSKLPVLQEKPTKCFLSLESSIQKSRIISEVNNNHGLKVTDKSKICTVFKDFYNELYKEEETENDVQDIFLNYTRKLSEEEKNECGIKIMVSDLKTALFSMNENATPGPNGLTVSFYKKFFDTLAPIYEQFLTLLYKGNNLAYYFKLSFITVLPKDSGSLLEIKNYRPISLLNTDFKMLTKAIVNKISPFLELLIHPDQAACIKGRNIQKTNHLIRDIISLANIKNDRAFILSIDQMKAYDRVSHKWLFKVLKHSNFSDNIINVIRLLYADARSQVLVNKTLSRDLLLGRGCRQGDSLSGTLYILCLEPLLEKVRQDISITGLHIPNKGCQKLAAFADDTNFFPRDVESVGRIIQTFTLFGRGSGSKINITKTQCMKIGNWGDFEPTIDNLDAEIKMVNVIKLLGLHYVNNIDQTDMHNWDGILESVRSKLNKIYYKQSSIFGRAILVNVFIEPKIIYKATIFDPPDCLIKEVRKIIRCFIFKGTLPCIKHTTLIQPKNKGGINLHDLNLKCTAIRLKYLHGIINAPNEYPLAVYFIFNRIPQYFRGQDYDTLERMESLPSFYTEILNDLQSNEPILLNGNPKMFYKELVCSKELVIGTQIKRLNGQNEDGNNPYSVFEDLHSNEFLSPTQRQISYRILFGITPTSEGLAKRHKRVFPCKICSGDQETEEHLFYFCPFIQDIKLDLIKMLRQPHNTLFDPYNAIFLNQLPNPTSDEYFKHRILLIHVYKEIIWKIRNMATHHGNVFCKRTIKKIFSGKIKWLRERHKECIFFQEITNDFI